ncbi:MAG TPA: glycosyltransferase family 2 protein [Chitinophagaceae bacterium]|nr:glycosyltransferase family 2 protein [Chitinophagaceae bacterium]
MISVIVPTYNREDCLYTMLESISKQANADFEVIVIDQSETASDYKIERILNSCKNLKYYHITTKGRPVSKNFGIEKANGNIVIFCDDDIIAEDNFLAEHIRVHDTYSEVGGVSCQLIEPHQQIVSCSMPLKITNFGRFINVPNCSYNGFVTSLNGGNMSFKQKALGEVGFFEENLRGTSMLEEPDIAYRLLMKGYKLYFSSGTQVKHFPQHNGNITIKGKQKREWLKGFFFNQYFFMFRNKRLKYFPFLFIFLVYRSMVESFKLDKMPFRFLDLPFTALIAAYKHWKIEKGNYNSPWYTPRKLKVEAINLKGN